ncbi:MAG TPA: hypothetical protein VH332_13015 [Nitrospira sp.]|jgi:hypothetical protein
MMRAKSSTTTGLASLSLGTLLLATLAVFGCSTGPEENAAAVTTQKQFATDARQYRQHAAELREMARRRQIEADVLARKENPDMERVEAKRELAKDLLEAADVFEVKAQELQRMVPHGMVQ